MEKSDRLFDILQRLRDGHLHRAQDLAQDLHVSTRTIYRDMDTLVASGVPIIGTRGTGYRMAQMTALPPLSLDADEVEALNLGIAIVAEAADANLADAAARLAAKIDAALPERAVPQADQWKFATSPFSNAARGASHMGRLRAAIRARQKLRLTYHSRGDRITTRTVRPLQIDNWGRVWTLIAWCEARNDFRAFRVDLIEAAQALPELFIDEPGKTMADYASAAG